MHRLLPLLLLLSAVACGQATPSVKSSPGVPRLSAKVPADFPVYPGAKIGQTQIQGSSMTVIWNVGQDGPDKVQPWYVQQLGQGDWQTIPSSPIDFRRRSDPSQSGILVVSATDSGSGSKVYVVFTFTAHSAAQLGLPSDLPVYPGASFEKGTDSGTVYFARWRVTGAKASQVADWYARRLSGSSWKLDSQQALGNNSLFNFERPGSAFKGALQVGPDDQTEDVLIGLQLAHPQS